MKSRVKTWQVRGIWFQQLEHKQVPQWGTEPGVRKGKRSLLAYHTRRKCSMETSLNSMKVKFGMVISRCRVGKLVSVIRAHASPPKRGRNQVSGGVSVPCWHATPVVNAPWKPLIIGEGQVRYKGHDIGGNSDWLGSHCWSRIRMSFTIRERDTS